MELMAIRQAVSRAPLDVDLEIVTDSKNAIGWLSLGWKRNKPEIVALCRDVEALTARRSGNVSYKHVRGHKGDSLTNWPPGRYRGVSSGGRLGSLAGGGVPL
jgi:ribonuclease HI